MEIDTGEYKILIVDDEPDILEFLTYNLKREGFNVYQASSGREAIEIAKKQVPDLMLLDIMLPEMDGIETCEEIRKVPALQQTTIAFLTARGEDYSQIAGFEAGGDDYITKPIKPKVLISRIKALLKRRHTPASDSKKKSASISDAIYMDRDRYIVVKKGQELELPKKEFELLNLLISKPGKVFTREEIFHTIWGDKIIVGDRTIDVHIRKLREKIGDEFIQTVKGVGYKFIN
jgi:two-component system alkaline phosphatase synthesis response regulator PhoP